MGKTINKDSPTLNVVKLVRKKTRRGAELLRLQGGLGEYPASGFESGKMGMRVSRTPNGVARFSLMREGADGTQETRVWVELTEDDLPYLMRVLML